MDPRTAAAWSLMERIGHGDGAFNSGGPYDQHGLLMRPRYRDISSSASPGMPRVSAPHFEAVLGQLLPHRGAWVHLSRTFASEAPGAPAVLGFVFWDCEGDRWVRFAALPWSAPDRTRPCGDGAAAPWQDPPEYTPCEGQLRGGYPRGRGIGDPTSVQPGRFVSCSGAGQQGDMQDGGTPLPQTAAATGPPTASRATPDCGALLHAPPGLCLGAGPPGATAELMSPAELRYDTAPPTSAAAHRT